MSDYNDGILLRPCLRMDTHFGDEYESIEFGDGTGYIKAAPILAKVGALHEEIDRLRDESAELRELVLDVMPIVCDGCHERLCEIPKEEHPFVTFSFADRMYELGIEVD